MMGIKIRSFGRLPPVTLEDLIPPDHVYRHLEGTLDLGFVRDLVRDAYAEVGRPSIDPVVFFKLQLIRFFEGLRSERQLMQVVADRLSLRWYLGYDATLLAPRHRPFSLLRRVPSPSFQRPGTLPILIASRNHGDDSFASEGWRPRRIGR